MSTPEAPARWVVDGFVHVHHPVTLGRTTVPDDATVLEGMQAKGWELTPPPGVVVVGETTAEGTTVLTAPGAEEAAAADMAAVTVGLVPNGPIDDVLDWVDGDPSRARAALAVETVEDGKNRTSLIPQLEAIAAGAPTTEADNG